MACTVVSIHWKGRARARERERQITRERRGDTDGSALFPILRLMEHRISVRVTFFRCSFVGCQYCYYYCNNYFYYSELVPYPEYQHTGNSDESW